MATQKRIPFGTFEKSLVIELARHTRKIVKIVTGALVLVFAWLKLSAVDIVPLASNLPAGIVLQISLALYYLCWVAGSSFDIDAQELVFEKAPNEGKIPLAGYGLVLGLAAVFGILCWVTTYQQFVAVLLVFWIVNFVGWLYLIKKLLPNTLNESHSMYVKQRHHAQLERLTLVREYMCGRWQRYRFACGAALIGSLFVLTFSNLAGTVAGASNHFSVDLIIASSILGFIVVVEGWMWFMRLKLKISLQVVEGIGRRYRISPK